MTWAIACGLIGLGFGLFVGFATSERREQTVTVELTGNSEPVSPRMAREITEHVSEGQKSRL